jgi:NAD(P)-dependent dehydrogenase (short-subunit alcohol dehydrogenase family)
LGRSLASVRKAAASILADHPRIDFLINNAGVMGIPEQRTTDGFETQLRYDPWRAYGQSKLANLHFALELDRRFRAAGVRPGASWCTRGLPTPTAGPERA